MRREIVGAFLRAAIVGKSAGPAAAMVSSTSLGDHPRQGWLYRRL